MSETLKILLIEDNPGDALLIKEALKESSYKDAPLFIATSMEETLQYVEENISLLLADLGLPDCDGLETVRLTNQHYPNSVLIVLTGLDNDTVAIESLRLGAQNYLNKNEIDHRILDKTISFALERHQIVQKLKLAEKELYESKRSLEKAQEIAHVGSWVADMKKNTAKLSQETERIFGLKPGEFDGIPASFFDMVHPEDSALVANEIADVARENRIFDINHRVLKKDGKIRWVHSQAEITFDEKGQLYLLIGTIQDITESKETELKLLRAFDELALASNQRSAILNTLPASIALIDDIGNIIKVNEKWLQFGEKNGMPENYKHIGANYIDVCEKATGIDKEVGLKVALGLKNILNGNQESFALEYPCDYLTEKRWFRLDLRKYVIEEKSGAVAMHIDITERKIVEEEMTLLLNNTEESFILLDEKLNIVSFNNQFKRLYKRYLNFDIVKGRNIIEFAQPERKDTVRSLYEKVLKGTNASSEITVP
jgi:PAS domain S-box-containing protein